MSSRVLHYNWAPYFKKPTPGGGVSVYCKNLIDYTTQKGNQHVTFLYSGTDYSYINKRPYIRNIQNLNHPHVPTFSLFNSPIIAPSHFAFDNPLDNVKQAELERCFQEFLDTQAPFSVIHFHNLEGITANCLRIAKASGAKVVFSLHNYWAVCPQVNLWRLEQSHCDDYLDGRACLACLPMPLNSERELAMRKIESLSDSLPLNLLKKLISIYYKIQRPLVVHRRSPLLKTLEIQGSNLPQKAEAYQFRRQEIVSLINRYVDVVLSVSDRSAAIYRQYGVDPVRLHTQYIGSKATQFQVPPQNPAAYSPGQPFRCVYIGVPRKDKGFYFLLEELRCLPATQLKTLELVIASKIADRTELDMGMQQKGQLLSLAQSLHRLIYHPGYSHDNLPKILDGIHLGIVPPLWEDNLPQVTYELLACRVPVLCSNRGGAQEFVCHPAFIFDPAKKGDFQQKLAAIRDNPHLLTEFWQAARTVRSLEQHFQELMEVYAGCGN